MSLSLVNSTITPLSSFNTFLGQSYDNILDFVEINISVKCDVGYTITYIYSQDNINISFSSSHVVSASADTEFFIIPVRERFFKLQIQATDGDMSYLNVQTIYKSSTTFQESPTTATNVNVTNTILAVNDASGNAQLDKLTFDVSNNLMVVGTVTTDISGQTVNIGTMPDISGNVNVTNTLLAVNDASGNAQLNKLTFDVSNNLFVSDTVSQGYLNTIATGLSTPLTTKITDSSGNSIIANNNCMNVGLFISNGTPLTATSSSLNTNITNTLLAVNDASGNAQLDKLTFDVSNNLMVVGNVNITNTLLAVNDASGNASLGTIITNTTGLALDTSIQTLITQTLNNGGFFWQAETVNNNDVSHVVNLSQKNAIIYSYFGNMVPNTLTDVISMTAYYSADGITFYQSDVTFTPFTVGASDFCSSQICGAGYVQLKITGLTSTCLITAYLNNI